MSPRPPPPPPATAGRRDLDRFRTGARQCLPLGFSVAAYGAAWGMLAGQKGLSVTEVATMSAFVFAGSAQFVVLDLWAPVLPVSSIVTATFVVHLRYLLMTAALRPVFGGMPTRTALPRLFLVGDENWAVTMAEAAKGRAGPAHLVGGGVVMYVAWLGGTVLGRLAGGAVDDLARFGLDFAFTAAFLALVVGMWRGPSDLLPWVAAAGAATLASALLPGKWYILAGGLLGSLAGALRRDA